MRLFIILGGAYNRVSESNGGENILKLWDVLQGIQHFRELHVAAQTHLIDQGDELLIHGEAVDGQDTRSRKSALPDLDGLSRLAKPPFTAGYTIEDYHSSSMLDFPIKIR